MEQETKRIYADDTTEGVSLLLRLRLPWLVVGLLGGVFTSLLVSRFETAISQHISLAFFLPLIVYISSAVGTQTETIYVRNLARHRINTLTYVIKEFMLGLVLGAVFGIGVGFFAYVWIGESALAWAVGLATFANVTVAPLVALLVSSVLYKERTDPALGAGPFTTVIQDIISILIYFSIAATILLR